MTITDAIQRHKANIRAYKKKLQHCKDAKERVVRESRIKEQEQYVEWLSDLREYIKHDYRVVDMIIKLRNEFCDSLQEVYSKEEIVEQIDEFLDDI